MRLFKILPYLCIFLAFLVIPGELKASDGGWNLRLDKYGISVYTRRIDGSPLLEFKAKVVVDAPITRIMALIEDENSMPDWFYRCIKAQLVKDKGSLEKFVYFVLKLPWPVSQRDVVCRITKAFDPAGIAIYHIDAVENMLPANEHMIRVTHLRSFWRITSLPDGQTEVFFQQHSDPGGYIPPFLANKLVVDMPYYSLHDLRRLVETGNAL